jgi:hypothetical protein
MERSPPLPVHCAWDTDARGNMANRLFERSRLLIDTRLLHTSKPKKFWQCLHRRRETEEEGWYVQMAGDSKVYKADAPSCPGLLKLDPPPESPSKFWKTNGPALVFAALCGLDEATQWRKYIFNLVRAAPPGAVWPRELAFFSDRTKARMVQEADIPDDMSCREGLVRRVVQNGLPAGRIPCADPLVWELRVKSAEAVKWLGRSVSTEERVVDEWLKERLTLSWRTPEWLLNSAACAGGGRQVVLTRGIQLADVAESQLLRDAIARLFPPDGRARCLPVATDPNSRSRSSTVAKFLLMQRVERAFADEPKRAETMRLPELCCHKVGTDVSLWVSPAGRRHLPLTQGAVALLRREREALRAFCADMEVDPARVRLALVPECRARGTCSSSGSAPPVCTINVAAGFLEGETLRRVLAHELAHAAGHRLHDRDHAACAQRLAQARRRGSRKRRWPQKGEGALPKKRPRCLSQEADQGPEARARNKQLDRTGQYPATASCEPHSAGVLGHSDNGNRQSVEGGK